MLDTLRTEIKTFLDNTGFTQFEKEVNKTQKLTEKLKSFASSDIGKMALGYFTVSKAVEHYKQMIEASNYQLEQEEKLYNVLKAQNFRDEQIESLKKYAGELQNIGVVGDEVTIAGMSQLASFKLSEQAIRQLTPVMQDMIVKSKGLNGTGEDAKTMAMLLGKAMNGQIGALERSGVKVSDYTKKILELGTEQQKAQEIVRVMTESIGKQNEAFLKTPEGKIQYAKNAIGDVYEELGMIFRNTRANYWEGLSEVIEIIKPFLKTTLTFLSNTFDTVATAVKGFFQVIGALPPEVKTAIGLISGFLLITNAPILGIFLAIEDFLGAMQGKESVIEPVYNALMDMLGLKTDFQDFRNILLEFWDVFVLKKPTEELSWFNATLKNTIELAKGLVGTLEMITSVLPFLGETIAGVSRLITNPMDGFDNFDYSITKAMWNSGYDKAGNVLENMDKNNELWLKRGDKEFQKDFFEKVQEMQNTPNPFAFNDPYSFKNKELDLLNKTNINLIGNEGQKKTIEKLKIVRDKPNVNYSPTTNITINGQQGVVLNEQTVKKMIDDQNKIYKSELESQIGGNFGLVGDI